MGMKAYLWTLKVVLGDKICTHLNIGIAVCMSVPISYNLKRVLLIGIRKGPKT